MFDQNDAPEGKMDVNALYLEEVFTDQKVGTIRRMTPVTAEGEKDSSRPVLYFGQAQMMTPAGALPLSFEIEAKSLSAAVAEFSEGAKAAMERTIEELKEMRRQQASSIVIPGSNGGGIPGGGKIQL